MQCVYFHRALVEKLGVKKMCELLLSFRQQSKRLTGSVAFFGFCISEIILLKQIQGLSSCQLVQQDEHRLPGLHKCRVSQHPGGWL